MQYPNHGFKSTGKLISAATKVAGQNGSITLQNRIFFVGLLSAIAVQGMACSTIGRFFL